ncbi:MAG: tyrosine-type recombinase/integrase [Proteobacteria bacterium]|nr:tyrosine-type recombinase/integrase [Pseudomonadota bacterium]
MTADKGRAKEVKAMADLIEIKTRHQESTAADLEYWQRHRLISRQDAELLNTFKDARKTLAQAAEEYKQSNDCGKEEMEARAVRIDRVVAILGPERSVGEIRHSDGERIKTVLRDGWKDNKDAKEKKYKAVTINKHLQDGKRMFTLQMAEGVIEHNPWGVLKGAKIPKEEVIDHTVLSHDDIVKVLAEAEISDKRTDPGNPASMGGNLTLFLLMFFGTGLRRKEAMAAKMENIDWQSRSLRLMETKNGEDRSVGLGDRLYLLLLNRKGETGYILPRFYLNSVSRAISRHFKRCGFKMRLHDTRHTYTTRLLDLGVLRHNAMGRTGHKDSRMLDHYTHPIFGEVYEDQFPFMQQVKGDEAEAAQQPPKNKKTVLRVVK